MQKSLASALLITSSLRFNGKKRRLFSLLSACQKRGHCEPVLTLAWQSPNCLDPFSILLTSFSGIPPQEHFLGLRPQGATPLCGLVWNDRRFLDSLRGGFSASSSFIYRAAMALRILSTLRSYPRTCITEYRSGEFCLPVMAMRRKAEISATVPGKASGVAL